MVSKEYVFNEDDYLIKDSQRIKYDQQKHPAVKRERSHNPSLTSYSVPFSFVESGRRNNVMICEGRKYIQNNKYSDKIYWKCSKWHAGCKARAITLVTQPDCITRRNEHNHPVNDKDDEDINVKTEKFNTTA